ncbi:hypothetical protein ACOMHN_014956 [Nucella lapillus]
MTLYGEQIHLQFTTKERYPSIVRFMANNYLLGFYGFIWVSEIISAIIASERCLCVLLPLRSQTILSTSTTTIIIVIINIIIVGLYSLVTTRYKPACAYDTVTQTNIWTVVPSQFYLDYQEFVDSLDAFVFGVIIPGVTVVVVVVATIVTMVKLRQAAAWRSVSSSSSNVSSREVALTVMLVYNSIFFVVCAFPFTLFRIAFLFLPEMKVGRRQHNLYFTGVWLSDVISYVNATFNFIIYVTMGSRYRQTLRQLISRGNKPGKLITQPVSQSAS